MQVKRHDDVSPGLPDAVAVLAAVVEDGAQAGVVEVKGFLVFVEVAASESSAVDVVSISTKQSMLECMIRSSRVYFVNAPVGPVEQVAIMRRNERLHAILANGHERLVEEIQRLVVVLAQRRLKVGHVGDADAALCAGPPAGLRVDPDANHLDAVGGQLPQVGILVGVGHGLDKVVARAGP